MTKKKSKKNTKKTVSKKKLISKKKKSSNAKAKFKVTTSASMKASAQATTSTLTLASGVHPDVRTTEGKGFARFTDRARKVLSLARGSAEKFKHDYIGTEHLLVGVIQEGNGVASTVLENCGVSLERAEKEITNMIKLGCNPLLEPGKEIPFTPRAKHALELGCDEATALDHKHVGTEHILLSLLKEGEGLAAQVLLNLGLTLENVRKETLEVLGETNVPNKE